MKRQIPPLPASFLPPAFFFLLVGSAGTYLRRFPDYGPVNLYRGQPIFAHYQEVLFSSAITLLGIGLLASFLFLRRARDGWPKVFAGVTIVLLIPVQVIFVTILELNLFEK